STRPLAGPIPSELGHLSALKKLHLWGNQLSGESTRNLKDLSRQIRREWVRLVLFTLSISVDPVPPTCVESCMNTAYVVGGRRPVRGTHAFSSRKKKYFFYLLNSPSSLLE
ncbi:unnamed protein product, partial [Ectocarpus sp. 4 AP-2014]